MKIFTKIALAFVLTLSIAAPAFAAYFEDQQTQITNPAPRARNVVGTPVRGHRATESMGFAPAQIDPDYQYFHESGIGSQS
jgi:hypothetical protein